MTGAGLKVYYDLMSQPSRAVILFVKATNIPFTAKPVALRKGEHLGEEYGGINPFHLVPAIDDNGFKITESVAILKYLADKHQVPDHWYPKDLKKRAQVDSYMAWQHLNLRMFGAMVFRTKVIILFHVKQVNQWTPRNWPNLKYNLRHVLTKSRVFCFAKDHSLLEMKFQWLIF